MNTKQIIKQQMLQAKAQAMVQKAGPTNPQWRGMFLKLWHEYKSIELRKQTNEAQTRVLKNQISGLKKGEIDYLIKKIGLQDSINSLVLSMVLEEVQTMALRDQIIQHCGKEWTIKKVWDVIRSLEKEKEEVFKLSETG